MKEKKKETRGRPLKEIDKKQFEGLCSIQCTEREICAVLGVADKTLTAWINREYGPEYGSEFGGKLTFKDIFEIKGAIGKISLRRYQFKQAEKNPTMAIWLGKQWLGQTDNIQVEAGNDTLKVAREILGGIDSVIE